ncbi:hypothetical protein [Chroococcus sp. FPU101]|uniref:hypothetical protein n=1 Tax=Chroococcus sp. FPU101 TaxID=1974212 RepID=UPI001A8FC045|nr:hypothetical protein [Chroococcus sp. FPU101]GFE70336.1 hypothetical protein CFPU101_29460 [Chroococcus sp. FPU101]
MSLNLFEIKVILEAAILRCEQVGYPLNEQQKAILLETVLESLNPTTQNPLDELSLEQRQTLLEFIFEQEQKNLSWKASLLNDWLNNQDSGNVQFIRETYGLGWLNRVQPIHWKEYLEQLQITRQKLQIGDRIEVSNRLWEWVQDNDLLTQDWYICQVVGLTDIEDGESSYTNCLIRFDNGAEFEIEGIYQWNQGNWRFSKPQN